MTKNKEPFLSSVVPFRRIPRVVSGSRKMDRFGGRRKLSLPETTRTGSGWEGHVNWGGRAKESLRCERNREEKEDVVVKGQREPNKTGRNVCTRLSRRGISF